MVLAFFCLKFWHNMAKRTTRWMWDCMTHLLIQISKYLDLEPLVLTLKFKYPHNIGWNTNVFIKYWCNLMVGPFHFKWDIYHVFKFFYHFHFYPKLLSYKKEEQSILNYIIFLEMLVFLEGMVMFQREHGCVAPKNGLSSS